MQRSLDLFLLRGLRVPPEPQPPHGAADSLRVFRAGRNLYRLRLLRWGVVQLFALFGIVFWVAVFIDIESEVAARRQSGARPPMTADSFAQTMQRAGQEVAGPRDKTTGRRQGKGLAGLKRGLAEIAIQAPSWVFPLLWLVKLGGVLVYLVQLPFTFLLVRLDYEMRWYMVTDRSLRIRHGILKVSESTMSFANIQQVELAQGPLQRLLGLFDVKVQSAGGGGGGNASHEHHGGDDMHLGLFHSVTNGPEIRDLIIERLRRFRESGLGDPDDTKHPVQDSSTRAEGVDPLLAAAREFAAEARDLRQALR